MPSIIVPLQLCELTISYGVKIIGGEECMSVSYYHMCRRGIGKPVEIRTRDGKIHRGVIHRVNNRMVYLRPLPQRNYGGYGYPYYGYSGWGWGFGWGIALGAIAALAFIPLFFW